MYRHNIIGLCVVLCALLTPHLAIAENACCLTATITGAGYTVKQIFCLVTNPSDAATCEMGVSPEETWGFTEGIACVDQPIRTCCVDGPVIFKQDSPTFCAYTIADANAFATANPGYAICTLPNYVVCTLSTCTCVAPSTSSPTLPPSLSPTPTPTSSPTSSATLPPSSSPTATPTPNPTATPTSSPTLTLTGSPTAAPTPIPTLNLCTCALAVPILVPSASLIISCSSAASHEPQPLLFVSSVTGPCAYDAIVLPSPATLGPVHVCGTTHTTTWITPIHPDCTDSMPIVTTVQQHITIARAHAPMIIDPPRDITVSCVAASGAVLGVYPPLNYQNDETETSCLISGQTQSGIVASQLHTCSPMSNFHIVWTAQAPTTCDLSLEHTQHVFALPAVQPVFRTPPSLEGNTLTCAQALLRQPLSLEYDNQVPSPNTLCALSGTALSNVTYSPSACGGTYAEEWSAEDMCGRHIHEFAAYNVAPAPLISFVGVLPANLHITCDLFVEAAYEPPVLSYTNNEEIGICALNGMSTASSFCEDHGPLGRYNLCGTTWNETWFVEDICARTLTHTRTVTVETGLLSTCCLVATKPACVSVGMFTAPNFCFSESLNQAECIARGGTVGDTFDACVITRGIDNNCNGLDENGDGIPDDGWQERETICGNSACFRRGVEKCINGIIVNTCVPGIPANNDTTCDGIDNDCKNGIDDGQCAGHGVCIMEAARRHKKKEHRSIADERHRRRRKTKMCSITPGNPADSYTVTIDTDELTSYLVDNPSHLTGACPLCECDVGYAPSQRCFACATAENGDMRKNTRAVCRPVPNSVFGTYEYKVVCDDVNGHTKRCVGAFQTGDILPSYNGTFGLNCGCQPMLGACHINIYTCRSMSEAACLSHGDATVFYGNGSSCEDCTAKIIIITNEPAQGTPPPQGVVGAEKKASGKGNTWKMVGALFGSVTFIVIIVVLVIIVVYLRRRAKLKKRKMRGHYQHHIDEYPLVDIDNTHFEHMITERMSDDDIYGIVVEET